MLDIKFIKENPEIVKKAIQDKQMNIDLDYFLEIDEKRKELLIKVEEFNSLKNKNNKLIVQTKDEEKSKLLAEMKELDVKAEKVKEEFSEIDVEYQKILWQIPQIPEKDSIVGGEEANTVIETNGEIPKFDFTIKDHIQLGKDCDLVDFERGVKLVGNRGYFLKNELAKMELALMQYATDFLTKRGFTQLSVPLMASDKFFYGTGHFPFAQEETFIAKDKERKFNLIGTSEIPLCGYFADEILEEEKLPIRVTAFSPCFRTEVGSYGKDTRGLYRVRQFYKVEQFVVCKNNLEESDKIFDEILNNSKEFMKTLDIPFHVLKVATGDMGAGKYKMCDLEGWMPSRDKYGEIGSCSALLDWQARRSNIRYKTKENKKDFVYTLNNTLVATPRIFISLLELNQDKEGNIRIPKVLVPYMMGTEIIKKQI